MKVKEILNCLEALYPISSAADYDNVGLLIGNETADVKSAVLALDCTESTLQTALVMGAELIITHHPIIFDGLKNIPANSVVYRLIRNGISVISMHTNLDTCDGGVNDALTDALNLRSVKKVQCNDGFTFRKGYIGEISPDAFAEYVSDKLKTRVKYVCGNRLITSVAVCGGAGGSELETAINSGADAFVTADIKHNIFIDAHFKGITLIDAGHFDTEDVIIDPLCNTLRNRFPDITFVTDHHSPIKYI